MKVYIVEDTWAVGGMSAQVIVGVYDSIDKAAECICKRVNLCTDLKDGIIKKMGYDYSISIDRKYGRVSILACDVE